MKSGSNIKKYSLESIIWIDHVHVERGTLPNDLNNLMENTISFGVVIKETPKLLIIVSQIERYTTDQQDDFSYTIIYKDAIIGRKKYGKIELDNIH